MIKKYELFENIHKGIDPYDEEDWDEKRSSLPYEYETKLNIGAVINPAVYIDTYKVVVSHMHGDADAYTKETYYVDEDEAMKMINFCSWVNEKWVNRNKIREISSIVFGDREDFLQGDSTADNQFPARPSISRVTYFDKDSVEHRVNISKKKIR